MDGRNDSTPSEIIGSGPLIFIESKAVGASSLWNPTSSISFVDIAVGGVVEVRRRNLGLGRRVHHRREKYCQSACGLSDRIEALVN